MPDPSEEQKQQNEARVRALRPHNDTAPGLGEARPFDPDTGREGTTNPPSAAPAGSTGPTGVAPPRRSETRWLVIAAFGVLGIVLILLLLG